MTSRRNRQTAEAEAAASTAAAPAAENSANPEAGSTDAAEAGSTSATSATSAKKSKKFDRLETIVPITMTDFEHRDDRAQYSTIRAATQLLYGDSYEAKFDQNIRNAARRHKVFEPEGAVLRVAVEGYDIEPFVYLRADAIEAYKTAKDAGETGSRVGRLKDGKKRQIVRLSPEDEAAYRAGTLALTVDKYPLEVASTPKKKKTADASATNGADPTAASNDQTADTPAATGDDQTGELVEV